MEPMDRFVTGGEARVDRTHTGADFESGAVHHAQGRNEAIPGVEAVDGRDQADWAGGHDNFRDTSGRQKRLRATPASKQVSDPRRSKAGKQLTIYKSEKASEDEYSD